MSTPKSDSSGNSSGSYCFIHDRRPRSGNSSSPDSVPDAKWWLNHYGIEKGLLEADAKLFAANYYTENSKTDGESNLIEGYCSTESKNGLKHPFSPCKSDGDSWLLGFESAINNGDLHSKGLDSDNCFRVEQPEKLCSDLDSQWIGVKKVDPWWHAVYKDDFASLNSQNLSHHNTNCDHPGVQSMHDGKASENCAFCLEKQTKVSNMPECTRGSFSSVSTAEALCEQGLKDPPLHETDTYFSDSAKADDPSEAQVPNCHLSRDELLEALCHSQTRAREAEKLAQQACDEKEHVFDLFFQQASCLFAYKQWLRMLQLETLCLHLRSKEHISSFSSLPPKGSSFGKNRRRTDARKKAGKQSISKYAVAFAVGLGLAGAGLLVGWTVGWLFPAL